MLFLEYKFPSKMGKKKQANQLGRSLIKDRFSQGNRRKVDNDTMVSELRFFDIFVEFIVFCLDLASYDRGPGWI